MKKLLFVVALCLPLLFAAQCGKKPAGHYTIDVKVEGLPTQVLLNYMSGDESRTDTAAFSGGVFRFEGAVDEPESAMLIVIFAPETDSQPKIFQSPMIIEAGAIKANVPLEFSNATVTGTPANDDAQEWNKMLEPVSREVEELNLWYLGLTPERQEEVLPEAMTKFQALEEQAVALAKNYVGEHPDSWFALSNLLIVAVDGQDADKAQALLDGFSESVRNTKRGREWRETIDSWRAVEAGAVAPEFSQADPEGHQVKLVDFRGQWVLIDFWASWCGPCRQENPNVVTAFNEFKDKGFTILGVSLDSNREAWLAAIEADGLDWTQVSDLQGWGNEAAKLYSVHNIPANFLLNPDGVIVARNLRGEALRAELVKNLGE